MTFYRRKTEQMQLHGQRLTEAMIDKDLNMAEVGRRSQPPSSRQAVAYFCISPNPGIRTIKRYAAAVGVPWKWLVE